MSVADRQLSLRLEEGRDPALVRQMRAFGRKAKKAAEKVTGKKPIEGFVDRVLAGEVQGWAFDPNKPGRRVHIVARHEGEIVAETLADLPRKDLTRGGKGDGKHGFNLRIPAAFLDGSPRRLRIEAAFGRTRVLLRRGEITVASSRPSAGQRKPKPAPAGGPSGALEGVANGVLLGWAAQPKSGGAPAVIDIYDDERYLGSVTADRPRPRRDEEPRGAKSFHFRLPDGADEALLRRLRARITGTQLDLRGLRLPQGAAKPEAVEAVMAAEPPAARVVQPERRVALLVFGSEAEEPLKRTMRSWSEQSWRSLDIGRVSGRSGGEGDTVFGPEDGGRLRTFMGGAEAVAVLRAGETLHPDLARTLSLADPLADVLTWEEEGGPRRRSEAWPLAIQLGQSLGGGYAVRAGALGVDLERLARAALEGEQALETALAAAPLHWRHLPAALSSRSARVPDTREPAEPPTLARVTVAVWPEWSETAKRTLLDVLGALSGMEVEVLVPASADIALEEVRASADCVLARKVDVPAAGGAGVWLKRLSEAATGEAVLLCRAGLSLSPGAPLASMARWALSPLAGAVTGTVLTEAGPAAGLTVGRGPVGWRAVPIEKQGNAPVLAAPGAFMAVARGKLAAVGGFDAERFPGDAADIDLCLRLRRMGWSSLALSDVRASAGEPVPTDEGAAMALLDPAELAAAAEAYPASDGRRDGSPA
ncbi:MAG TPA: hypothetical protein VF559_06485 [Caulobacteraceae bacterium]